MIQTKDIYWLAGLLEGEGCFYLSRVRGTLVPMISLKMDDSDVVEHAHTLLKTGARRRSRGAVPVRGHDTTRLGKPDFWVSKLGGYRAAGWMMTLYPLMGERRQRRIREILNEWSALKKRGAYLHKVGTPVGN